MWLLVVHVGYPEAKASPFSDTYICMFRGPKIEIRLLLLVYKTRTTFDGVPHKVFSTSPTIHVALAYIRWLWDHFCWSPWCECMISERDQPIAVFAGTFRGTMDHIPLVLPPNRQRPVRVRAEHHRANCEWLNWKQDSYNSIFKVNVFNGLRILDTATCPWL